MKPKNRNRHKGRSEGGSFTSIPHAVQDSVNWHRCSGTAIKLLCELARQFNGKNNGDLCAALSVLKRRGWNSGDVLTNGLRELRHYGFLVLTRQGGLHRASLYALGWRAIDDCGGKLDVPATNIAPGGWKHERDPFVRPQKKTPDRHPVQTCTAIRFNRPEPTS